MTNRDGKTRGKAMSNGGRGCGQGACTNGKPCGRNKDAAGLETSSRGVVDWYRIDL